MRTIATNKFARRSIVNTRGSLDGKHITAVINISGLFLIHFSPGISSFATNLCKNAEHQPSVRHPFTFMAGLKTKAPFTRANFL
jgi:hypothetical protein